jgi:hypothetical protein
LDRVAAIKLLKEIASKIPELDPQAISIVESEPNNSLQTCCTIHFKGLSTGCREQIKIIVKNHSFVVLENEIDLAIYDSSNQFNY